MCFIMINVKSSNDILQGLSKLDHLLKVSAFQVHKLPIIEEQKSTFDSILGHVSDDNLVMHLEKEIIKGSLKKNYYTEKIK